jgi:hypothetical protein
MTLRRFGIAFVVVLLLQGTLFAWHYRDLLYFRQPVAAIEKDNPATFAAQAESALLRDKITRKHLDTIADAAAGFRLWDIEVRALKKRAALDPRDQQIKLRLADALRRAQRFTEAEQLYAELARSRNERP